MSATERGLHALEDLTFRAAPLFDRSETATSQSEAGVTRRWTRWAEVIGGSELLRRRLEYSGGARSIAALLDGAGVLKASAEWTETFSWAVVAAPTVTQPEGTRPELPFVEAFDSVMGAVRLYLLAAHTESIGVLAAGAVADLETGLLRRLTYLANEVLGEAFYKRRFERVPVSAFAEPYAAGPETTEVYRDFVDDLREGGLAWMLEKYPVLARLLCQEIEQWVHQVGCLCRRLVADQHELACWLGNATPAELGWVVAVQPDCSDRHHRGATTMVLTLVGGTHLVYKPRGCAGEQLWARAVGWWNDLGLGSHLTIQNVLDRRDYHWAKWIPAKSVSTAAEVSAFYERIGTILVLLHALCGTDIHFENLIANGANPVLVDLEMLLNPGPNGYGKVERTGLLPQWQAGPNGSRYDLSGLGADESQDRGLTGHTWKRLHTDQIHRVAAKPAPPTMDHRVCLDGAYPDVGQFLDPFSTSFRTAYRCIIEGRESFCRAVTPDMGADCPELRVLLRDTATYANLQATLTRREYLADGLDRTIQIDWLARPLAWKGSGSEARYWIYEAERRAMEQGDIPHFSTTEWRAIPHINEEPGLDRMGASRNGETAVRQVAVWSERTLRKDLNSALAAIEDRFPGSLDRLAHQNGGRGQPGHGTKRANLDPA